MLKNWCCGPIPKGTHGWVGNVELAERSTICIVLGVGPKTLPYPIAQDYQDVDHGLDQIRPRRILVEKPPVDLSMRGMFRQAFMSRKKSTKTVRGVATKEWSQRCAVQVRYTNGGSAGKWFSHGSYIARESKTKVDGQGVGFDQNRTDVPVAQTAKEWRRQKDEIFFRLILSPEFGERLDLQEFTREFMSRVGADLDTGLEWIAVEHHNTDNPHVHVVLRGKQENGADLRIPPEYVKNGARAVAEELVTNRLGYRSLDDIIASQRREIKQSRFTGLDRKLKQRAEESPDGQIVVDHRNPALDEIRQATEFHLLCRLRQLRDMGLATEAVDGTWRLDPELERSLRAVQKSVDRIKTMEAHGVMASDSNMPFKVLRAQDIDQVEGRILVHGQDEYSGNNFALIETIQGEIVRLPHVKEIAGARKYGQLEPGRYVSVSRVDDGFRIQDSGDSDQLLSDQTFMLTNRERLSKVVPNGFPGWLGSLRKAVDVPAGRSKSR